MRRIDCHVHLVGDGSDGSGCWFQLKTVWHRFLARTMVKGIGIPASALRTGLDRLYVERLVEQVRQSSMDAVVLLAQDIPYSDSGEPLPEHAGFFVPNSFLLKVVARHPGALRPRGFHPPGRADAMDELERCLAAGARVLKLLPNCLNIDCSERRYRPFWERMAAAGMILLSHTGGEMSLPVLRPEFADPRLLRSPLESGVTVIAAHAAGRSGLWDPDHTEALIGMFNEFPRLYADNSALCSPLRCRTIRKILPGPVMSRLIHGSDYPIPVGGFGPWRKHHVDWSTWRRTRKEPNSLERDAVLKHAIGFQEQTFTRMAGLRENDRSMNTYYLQMVSPDELVPSASVLRGKAPRLREINPPDGAVNRRFYRDVGRDWSWTERVDWPLDRWNRYLAEAPFSTVVIELGDEEIGYSEIRNVQGEVEIVNFGLLEAFIGRGLGGASLVEVVRFAWKLPDARRVWLHTCDEDHPRALKMYQSRGFDHYRTEDEP